MYSCLYVCIYSKVILQTTGRFPAMSFAETIISDRNGMTLFPNANALNSVQS